MKFHVFHLNRVRTLLLVLAAVLLLAGCYPDRWTGNYDDIPELGLETAVRKTSHNSSEAGKLQLEILKKVAEESAPPYTINGGDKLEVMVYSHPDLSVKTVVTPDGFLGLVLVGQIKVKGLTLAEASAKIEKALSRFIRNPRVGLSPYEIVSETATIAGTVHKPGIYPITDGMRLADLFAKAGGAASRYYDGQTVSAVDYAPPKLSGVSVFRCSASGAASSEGTYLSVRATGGCTAIGAWNSVSLKLRTRSSGGAWSGYTALTNGTAAILSGFAAESSHTVEITATDTVGNTAVVTRTVPSRRWAMKFRPKGLGAAFGKSAESDNVFEVTPEWKTKLGLVEIESPNYILRKLPVLTAGLNYWLHRVQDADGAYRGGLSVYRSTSYGEGLWINHARTIGGTQYSNRFALYIDDAGAPAVTFDSAATKAAWQKALDTRYFPGDTVSFPSSGDAVYCRFAGDVAFSRHKRPAVSFGIGRCRVSF